MSSISNILNDYGALICILDIDRFQKKKSHPIQSLNLHMNLLKPYQLEIVSPFILFFGMFHIIKVQMNYVSKYAIWIVSNLNGFFF
jgi:hypothetical protein